MWAQATGTSHRKLHTYKREPEELLPPSGMFLQRRPSKQHGHSCPRTVGVRVPTGCSGGRCSGAGSATPASSRKSFYYLSVTGEETEVKEMKQHAHRWLVGNSARLLQFKAPVWTQAVLLFPAPAWESMLAAGHWPWEGVYTMGGKCYRSGCSLFLRAGRSPLMILPSY